MICSEAYIFKLSSVLSAIAGIQRIINLTDCGCHDSMGAELEGQLHKFGEYNRVDVHESTAIFRPYDRAEPGCGRLIPFPDRGKAQGFVRVSDN